MYRNVILYSVTTITCTLFKRVYANKYCAFELAGEAKYYVCPRNEFCCNFGCCVNSAFQFYQLWYYWLLLIFMFMVCSGGGWWYRYCRQPLPSPCPGVTSGFTLSGAPGLLPVHDESMRRARVTYRPGLDHTTLYLQRVWKGPPGTVPPPPTYSPTQDELHHQPFLNDRPECPYYQLYGPPPSYDSVVQLSGASLTTNIILSPVNSTGDVQAISRIQSQIVQSQLSEEPSTLGEAHPIEQSASSELPGSTSSSVTSNQTYIINNRT